VIVLTEGVYGMTGDVAKLKEITWLKDKYEARLFVDDAHGVGVMGETGRGTGEYCGVQDKIDIYFATFAKAFASIGGFSASNKEVVEWIRYNARTQVFAKSLPMIYVRSLKKTLELVINGQERRRRLFEVSRKLSRGLRELGFFVGNVESPIVPVFVPLGDMRVTMDWIQYLRNKGIFVTGVMYPVIPKGFMMFRIIPTANHTDEQIETTLQAFRSLREDRNLKLEMDESAVSRIYGKK
jgi:glycine C-acetyltransferase